MAGAKPRVGVFKFASCDGCQLTLLDAEDELLAVGESLDLAYFAEATRKALEGTFDLSLVEGSISTLEDAARIQDVRRRTKTLVTIGACATAGGVQALRNFKDVREFLRVVYARPEYIDTLAASTPIAAHVRVDFELRGCPIDKRQLLEVLRAYLRGAAPNVRAHSVCIECKRRGTVCVMVARGTPCLGPVTHAGCGALCPAYDRGCYGCYGPAEDPNTASASRRFRELGRSGPEVRELFSSFNVWSPAFRKAREEA
ncbi:MAG: oxidoreductase [Elusimicrobia bacterium]|nr:oxidoreductase [Elusimicrobiota bacterium]